MWAILTQGAAGETYLIGADGERNNLEVLRSILQRMGRDADDFDWVRDRPGRSPGATPSTSSKLRRELGWRPRHTDFSRGAGRDHPMVPRQRGLVARPEGGRRGQVREPGTVGEAQSMAEPDHFGQLHLHEDRHRGGRRR